MKILYIGDIMGKPGRDTVKAVLPRLKKDRDVDFVVAQGENLSHGKGMQIKATEEMMAAGVDAFTGGNWTLKLEEIIPWLEDPARPVTRPANFPEGTPGKAYKIVDTPFGKILIVSLLGQIVGYIDPGEENPLQAIDSILAETQHEKLVARIVNFHGDYSSEKVVIGQFLDGLVSLVVGDHWHVPTADAQVLPKGTAHITDVGMVGSADSCLGVKSDVILKRWLTDEQSRNELEEQGRRQFCAVLVEINPTTGRATSIEQIIEYLPE